MEAQNAYTFELMTTDGAVTVPFMGDIKSSSFISNYLLDMNLLDVRHIELLDLGDRNMTRDDIIRFYHIWDYLSSTKEGLEFTKDIRPDYFEDNQKEMLDYLPAGLYEILKPTQADIINHKEWLDAETAILPNEMDTTVETQQLLKNIPFQVLVKYINYANFLAIDIMINLCAKLIADYLKYFIKIKKA
jgi:hypothetical protein